MEYMKLDIEQNYFSWLCEIIHADQEDRSYWLLMKDLYRTKYYSLIEHDENRAYDGMELREQYLSQNGYLHYDIDGECSMLEMLIALARRMDFETTDPYDLEEADDHTAYWFWEMIDNLGLIKFDDDSYVELDGQTYVDWYLDIFLRRAYKRNGLGGLFPLKYGCEDQRKTEIWYQMAAYLNERSVG